MLYNTLRDLFCGARERHEAHGEGQTFSREQEKIIAFKQNRIEFDKTTDHCQVLPLARRYV